MNNTDFTVGADPELVLVRPDKTLLKVRGVIPERGQFGVDGHGYIAELRPEPAIFPKDLTENLRISLASQYHKLKNYKWRAGPWILDKPLGGHIHFGLPMETAYTDALEKLMPIILALIEPASQAKKRRTFPFYHGIPYGVLDDVRVKPYGWEWRVPSSFIVTPGITTGVFALCKALIFEEVVKGEFAFSKLPANVRKELNFTQQSFYQCNRKQFLKQLPPLWKIIKGLSYFQKEGEGSTLWSSVSYLRRFAIEKGGFFVPPDIKVKGKWALEDIAPTTPVVAGPGPPAGGGAHIVELQVPQVRLNNLGDPDTLFTPDYIMEV